MTLVMAPTSDFGPVRNRTTFMTALQAVDLSNSSDLNESDILRIVKHTRNLASLALENCGISDAVVQEIVKECRMLTSINLSENNLLTDASLSSIANHCVYLTEIDIRDCNGVTVSGIFGLVEKSRNLRTLVVSSFGFDMNDTIEAAIRNINSELSITFV